MSQTAEVIQFNNNEIVAAFTSAGLSEEIAKTVVTLIAKRQIPHTSIQY